MRTFRAGDTVEDVCRVCKLDRLHSVIVVDGTGTPVRVQCDYCGSQHQYRGGPVGMSRPPAPGGTARAPAPEVPSRPTTAPRVASRPPFPIVSERDRSAEPIMIESASGGVDLELVLRRIIREEAGVSTVVPAEKWRGGTLILKPGNPALHEKSWPIETLFHKIVMIRNRLRTLEQQVNASDLAEDAKVKLQGYISGCYGSLTSFNVLFADEIDQFKGGGAEG